LTEIWQRLPKKRQAPAVLTEAPIAAGVRPDGTTDARLTHRNLAASETPPARATPGEAHGGCAMARRHLDVEKIDIKAA
jgi:hypothetical protein